MSSPAASASSLVDGYGRPVTDLRISVTARCNFHCSYCHNEGQGPVRRVTDLADELTVDEVSQLARVAVGLGISAFKLSGGEPLVRADCEDLVAACAEHAEVSLVTNGSLLKRRASLLKRAGLSRLNVSLDSLEPLVFRELGRGHLSTVLEGIDAALAAGLAPVKLNVVLVEQTLKGLPAVLGFVARTPGLTLQLIEYMPERVGHPERGVPVGAVHRLLAEQAEVVRTRVMHGRRVYEIGAATVEVVDPVGNAAFCAACRRLRVTARGELKGCLNRSDDQVPIRGLDDEGLREAFRRVVASRRPYYRARALVRGAAASRSATLQSDQ